MNPIARIHLNPKAGELLKFKEGKTKKLILAWIFVLALGLEAEAANWEYFYHNEDRVSYYDTTAVTPKGNGIVAMEVKTDWAPQAIDRFEDKNLSYTRAVLEIDCQNRIYRQLLSTSYRKDGEVSSVNDKVTDWMHIPDKSLVDLLKSLVCQ
jgi:hypothetical protein